MTAVATPPPVAASQQRPGADRRARRVILVACAVIVVAGLGGLAFGSHPIPVSEVIQAFTTYDAADGDHIVVRQARVPRVLLGLLVGAALGVAGLLMQSFTRNPLADPGLLGVNAGAAGGVVVAIAYLGVTETQGYVWFAFAGAAAAAVAVYLLGAAHRSAATPVRMTLAGAAFSMAMGAVTGMVLVSNEATFLRFRYWSVGTLQGRGLDVIGAVAPFVAVGLVLAFTLVRMLDAVAMGEETARGLGTNIAMARGGAALAVVLLAGAATAGAGPIAFVGLAAAHIVRAIVGPSHRLLVPCVLVVGPAMLLSADLVGRLAVAPGELQTGIAVAVLGSPLFIALVRSRRVASL